MSIAGAAKVEVKGKQFRRFYGRIAGRTERSRLNKNYGNIYCNLLKLNEIAMAVMDQPPRPSKPKEI